MDVLDDAALEQRQEYTFNNSSPSSRHSSSPDRPGTGQSDRSGVSSRGSSRGSTRGKKTPVVTPREFLDHFEDKLIDPNDCVNPEDNTIDYTKYVGYGIRDQVAEGVKEWVKHADGERAAERKKEEVEKGREGKKRREEEERHRIRVLCCNPLSAICLSTLPSLFREGLFDARLFCEPFVPLLYANFRPFIFSPTFSSLLFSSFLFIIFFSFLLFSFQPLQVLLAIPISPFLAASCALFPSAPASTLGAG